jgi:hypothetical protein
MVLAKLAVRESRVSKTWVKQHKKLFLRGGESSNQKDKLSHTPKQQINQATQEPTLSISTKICL